MVFSKFNLNNFIFFGICICLITSPFNYKLIGFLRLVDCFYIFIFVIFIFLNPKISKIRLILLSCITLILFISSILGYKKNGFDPTKIVFIYKYFLIFSIPWVIVSIIKQKRQIEIINQIILIIFILLSCWSYIYVYLELNNIIIGNFY